jgi:hypothetical protein
LSLFWASWVKSFATVETVSCEFGKRPDSLGIISGSCGTTSPWIIICWVARWWMLWSNVSVEDLCRDLVDTKWSTACEILS